MPDRARGRRRAGGGSAPARWICRRRRGRPAPRSAGLGDEAKGRSALRGRRGRRRRRPRTPPARGRPAAAARPAASAMPAGSSITRKTRTSPASPSCSAAFRLPSARSGREAISRAATKPVKSPIVLRPPRRASRQSRSPAATASAAQHLQHRVDAAAVAGHAQQRTVELVEGGLGARGFRRLPAGRRARCGPGRSSRSAAPRSRPRVPACRRRRGGSRRPMRWIGTAASGRARRRSG